MNRLQVEDGRPCVDNVEQLCSAHLQYFGSAREAFELRQDKSWVSIQMLPQQLALVPGFSVHFFITFHLPDCLWVEFFASSLPLRVCKAQQSLCNTFPASGFINFLPAGRSALNSPTRVPLISSDIEWRRRVPWQVSANLLLLPPIVTSVGSLKSSRRMRRLDLTDSLTLRRITRAIGSLGRLDTRWQRSKELSRKRDQIIGGSSSNAPSWTGDWVFRS
mmetsp:Transcript_45421/g.142753  ORF Transcript_45421/g.142753 Transcript_45421/m.142753 type:complete len:219 (-) Transcript_45421:1423-2079(-)